MSAWAQCLAHTLVSHCIYTCAHVSHVSHIPTCSRLSCRSHHVSHASDKLPQSISQVSYLLISYHVSHLHTSRTSLLPTHFIPRLPPTHVLDKVHMSRTFTHQHLKHKHTHTHTHSHTQASSAQSRQKQLDKMEVLDAPEDLSKGARSYMRVGSNMREWVLGLT